MTSQTDVKVENVLVETSGRQSFKTGKEEVKSLFSTEVFPLGQINCSKATPLKMASKQPPQNLYYEPRARCVVLLATWSHIMWSSLRWVISVKAVEKTNSTCRRLWQWQVNVKVPSRNSSLWYCSPSCSRCYKTMFLQQREKFWLTTQSFTYPFKSDALCLFVVCYTFIKFRAFMSRSGSW